MGKNFDFLTDYFYSLSSSLSLENAEGTIFRKDMFNIIYSGTGTGKTKFVACGGLLSFFPDVQPSQVLWITSRSAIRDQQSAIEKIKSLGYGEHPIIRYWNMNPGYENIDISERLNIMNIQELIYILERTCNPVNFLDNIRLVVFDECHAIYADTFMKDISAIRMWIKEELKYNLSGKTFVGLTATPGIMFYAMRTYGVHMHVVNPEPIFRYKAKHLICTERQNIISILESERFTGKTIIMSNTVLFANKLAKRLEGAEALCSKSSPHFTPRMRLLREYIIEHEELPPYRGIIDEEHPEDRTPIKYLITTSTFREGINLKESSGVRNVVCCFPDELHVIQFAGRCRNNIDNLVVLDNSTGVNAQEHEYISYQRSLFGAFMQESKYKERKNVNREWFNTIAGIVDEDFEDIEVTFTSPPKTNDFFSEVDKKFVGKEFQMPSEALCELAWHYRIFGEYKEPYTNRKILYYLRENGYEMTERRSNGIRYKTITGRKKEGE